MKTPTLEVSHQPLPEEISALFWFIRNLSSLDELGVRQAWKKIEVFQSYLTSQFNFFFPKSKPCSNDTIGNHIFVSPYNQRDTIAIAKYELAGLISTLARSVDDIKESLERKETSLAFHELKLIGACAGDSVEIIERILLLKGISVKYDFARRNVIDSIDSFKLSRCILGGLLCDELENRATSVFLLRQALELRIKNALGIHSFVGDGGVSRISGFIFVDIIQENQEEINLPLDFAIFQKIVKWTNVSIHSGWVPPAWKIDWAHNYLEPLFQQGYNKKTISLYGAIKIKRNFLDNIEFILQEFLRSRDQKIQRAIRAGSHSCPDKYDSLKIVRRYPESVLMDDA